MKLDIISAVQKIDKRCPLNFLNNMKRTLESMIYTYSEFMKYKFNRKVFRVGLSTGLKCPHRIKTGGCIFCDPETFTGQYQSASLSVQDQLKEAIPRIIKSCGDVGLLAYFQDETSTAGDIEFLDRKYREALKHPDILGLIVSTRPEYVTEEIVQLLKSYSKPVSIEIGLQTVKEASLEFLNRGHDLNTVEKAIQLCDEYSIDLGVHIIIGIPGESMEDMHRTIQFITSRPAVKEVKFHNLVVYRNTALEKLYYRDKFEILSIDRYIEILCQLIPYLRGDIVISRLFTSNIRKSQVALGEYPGSKPEWLNKLRFALIEQELFQGCKTEFPFKTGNNID